MDETVSRSRYSHRSTPVRRRKKSIRETNTFFENFMRQVVFALVILAVVGITKSVNTQVTNFLCDKFKAVISHDIKVKEIYYEANDFLDKILNKEGRETTGEGKIDEINTEDGISSRYANDSSGTAAESNEDAEIADKDAVKQSAEDTDELIEAVKEKHSFTTPVLGTVTSGFGMRIHPAFKNESFHTGIDIEAEKGVPIKAALDGNVIEAGSSKVYGKYIKVEHGDGIVTLYGHCSQLLVKKGQKVAKGKTIAKVGNTGVAVGTHLHFEVWKEGKPLDPSEFIEVPG
ncbi:MAG: M23 family metallopeptidase [Clostridia bacterium]|nr:M23 family metallopeptidase [Clostridia bacterium]